jgi:hypothetical protein
MTSAESQRIDGPKRRRVLLFFIAAIVALCAGTCLVLALTGDRPAASSAPARLPLTVCAGVAIGPQFQVGIVWVSPISSFIPPVAASNYAVCAQVPAPGLPVRPWGQWVFPP